MRRLTAISKNLFTTAVACAACVATPVLAGSSYGSAPAGSTEESVTDAAGEHHGSAHFDRYKRPHASLQAQAVNEVMQDRVRITLAAEISDASQTAVSEALGAAMNTAMADASKNTDDIQVTSGNYRVWPINDEDGRISNWRGRGELYLESGDFAAASRLAASLADTLAISSLSFFVSPQKRAAEEEKLLDQAAAAFHKRAQALTHALGYSDYRLRTIELGGSGAQFEMAPRAMQAAMFKSADSIPLEGGTEMISVSIQGSVFLVGEKR